MLSVIGIGPGSQAMMTMEAIEALQAAEIVVGYKTYTHLVKAFTGDKQVIKTGMCKEIERCQAAIELAQAGHNVALISSGDAGIYGMAGLVLELVGKQKTGRRGAAHSWHDSQHRRRLFIGRAADA
ncbi:precorrin-3B C17-methyltransferase [Salmonella enterica subsp. enterica]|nr:precorrin-3B C17-methyltransferase [Salmonella enterica subsp. enterica]